MNHSRHRMRPAAVVVFAATLGIAGVARWRLTDRHSSVLAMRPDPRHGETSREEVEEHSDSPEAPETKPAAEAGSRRTIRTAQRRTINAGENPDAPPAMRRREAENPGAEGDGGLPDETNRLFPRPVKAADGPPRRLLLAVPAGLADAPLPIFLHTARERRETMEAGEEEEKPAEFSAEGTDLTEQEGAALREAEEIFAHAMDAAPTKSETDPVYEDWWRAATVRAEEHLRAALGWDRFNKLSLAAAREFLAEGAP